MKKLLAAIVAGLFAMTAVSGVIAADKKDDKKVEKKKDVASQHHCPPPKRQTTRNTFHVTYLVCK